MYFFDGLVLFVSTVIFSTYLFLTFTSTGRQFAFFFRVGFKYYFEYLFRKYKPVQQNFSFTKSGNVYQLLFQDSSGNTKKLLLPVDRTRRLVHNRHVFWLYRNSKQITKLDISPEFPILVSAKDLQGDEIRVFDIDEQHVKTFRENEVPVIHK